MKFFYAVTGSSSGLLLNILSLLEAVEAAVGGAGDEAVDEDVEEAVVDEVTEAEVVVVASCCCCCAPLAAASAVAEVKLAVVKLAAEAANCSAASEDLRLQEVE